MRASFFDKTVGKTIAERRKALGIEQKELGMMIGLTRSSMSRLERGIAAFSLPRLLEACGCLELSMVEFFRLVEETDRYEQVLKK